VSFKEPCSNPFVHPDGTTARHWNGHMPDMNHCCIQCGEVDLESRLADMKRNEDMISGNARQAYHEEVKYVALSIFSSLIAKETIQDFGAVMRESNKTAKTPMADMVDASLSVAIHFVGELKKLSPPPKYVEHFRSTLPPTLPVLPRFK
jgi:hypothetical protein